MTELREQAVSNFVSHIRLYQQKENTCICLVLIYPKGIFVFCGPRIVKISPIIPDVRIKLENQSLALNAIFVSFVYRLPGI